MADILDIDLPPICDDPGCLNCRTNVLFTIAKALEDRDTRPEKPVSSDNGAVFTLVHSAAALLHGAGVSLDEQLRIYKQAHGQIARLAEMEKQAGLPRMTHNPRNAHNH